MCEDNDKGYSYHTYGQSDVYRIDPRYGTNEEYKQLAAEMHKRFEVSYGLCNQSLGLNIGCLKICLLMIGFISSWICTKQLSHDNAI